MLVVAINVGRVRIQRSTPSPSSCMYMAERARCWQRINTVKMLNGDGRGRHKCLGHVVLSVRAKGGAFN